MVLLGHTRTTIQAARSLSRVMGISISLRLTRIRRRVSAPYIERDQRETAVKEPNMGCGSAGTAEVGAASAPWLQNSVSVHHECSVSSKGFIHQT